MSIKIGKNLGVLYASDQLSSMKIWETRVHLEVIFRLKYSSSLSVVLLLHSQRVRK